MSRPALQAILDVPVGLALADLIEQGGVMRRFSVLVLERAPYIGRGRILHADDMGAGIRRGAPRR